ncbi:janus A-like protein [Leptotrombidium deliense]|uniref:Sex-regulated protein janus-A n=1 Tax=Leptotrombidium deliense TaxID=299467 RepID=A0A443SUT5_9ACAR|nr:janus A-like protein [Leptotrombidium deliense]
MESLPKVDIDEGTFKYVLVKLKSKDSSDEMTIVRGYKWASYHGDIVDKLEEQLGKMRIECDCVGGGRITHDKSEQYIKVYGYSQGYGKADHKMTCELLKQNYPTYKIEWTDDGY